MEGRSPEAGTRPALDILRVAFDHPDAVRLTEEVQQEYVARYGGRDDTPLEPAMFAPPQGAFFVGYLAGDPVATGAWRRTVLEALGTTQTAEIKRMYVAPRAQRAGHARRMLAHLEATARAAGVETLVLETGVLQPEAVALYESAGYVAVPGFGFHRDSPLSRCFGRRLV